MSTRSRRPWPAVVLPAAVLVAALLVPFLGSAAAQGPSTAGNPAAGHSFGYTTYPANGVRVVFPTAHPEVYLVDAQNASLGAGLSVDGLLELAAGGLPRPTVLAAAYPAEIDSFNTTATVNLTAQPLGFAATFAVHAVAGTLWSGGSVTTFPGPALGNVSFFLNYTELPDHSGVSIAWNAIGWPWTAPGDLLALELRFGLVPTSTIAPCSSPVGAPAEPTACPGTSLESPGIVWDPTITSVIASGSTGASASLTWSRPSGAVAPTDPSWLVGTYAPTNASMEVVLGAPAHGAAALAGILTFSLFPPTVPAPPFVLRGDAAAYASGLVATGAAIAVGLGLYRRQNLQALAEL